MYRNLRKTSPDSEDFQTRTSNLKSFNTILKKSIHTAKKNSITIPVLANIKIILNRHGRL